MHYKLNYDSASTTTKGNIDKWRVSLRVIYQDHERPASPRWVSMFVRRTTSIIMSPVDFCDGNFSITFTSIPILFFFLFPFFSPCPCAKGCGAPRIDFRFQFNGVVVSEPRSSNTNFALSASARRRWLPSCQTPFARSSKSPEDSATLRTR